jgi:AcrR family transcriptional regulator
MSRGKSAPAQARDVPAKRPGGRTAENSKRIQKATIELLVQGGFDAVTFQEVAKRSDVGRATIYRRWDTPSKLVRDAVLDVVAAEISPIDTGSLRGDLKALLNQIGRFISGPIGVAAMIASLSSLMKPEDKGSYPSIWLSRLEAIAPMFQRAIDRGELSQDQDVEALFASLAGALYFRIVVMGEAIDEAWIERVLGSSSTL